jgi:periplasmic protein CpxP/Spy
MRNFTKMLILPALAAGALIAGTAVADGGWGGHHHHGGGFGFVLKQLNLSDSQKASVKQIMQAGHAQNKTQFQALMTAHQALESATPGTPAYQTDTTALAQAAAAAASARVTERASEWSQIYTTVLNTQQQATVAQLQAQRAAHVAQWQAQHAGEASGN